MNEERRRMCSVPDALIESDELGWKSAGRTPTNPLLIALMADLRGLTAEQWSSTVKSVYDEIRGACGFFGQLTDTARIAHCRIYVDKIDKPGGTLAWSELANGTDAALKQMMDWWETWALFDGRGPAGKMDARRVLLHETLHLLGFSHTPENAPASILKPYYDPDIFHLTPYDVQMLQRVYGPPVRVSPPSPPTGTLSLAIHIQDAKSITIPGYRLVKE